MPISLFLLWNQFDDRDSNFRWGFAFIFSSHYWLIYLHPLTWLGFSWFASIFISISILLICSSMGGILVMIWGYFANKIFQKEKIAYQNLLQLFSKAFFLSSLWAFGELFLSKTSFFWIGLSESLIPGDIYLAGLSRWIGSSGLCTLLLIFGFWIWLIYKKKQNKLHFKRLFSVGLIVITIIHLIGAFLIKPSARNSSYPIAIWQTNFPTRKKIFMRNKEVIEDLNFIQKNAISKGAKLLVAPEGTLKSELDFVIDNKINTLIGGFRTTDSGLKSSLLAYEEDDRSYSYFIDKHRLVPLGEKVPNISNKFNKGLSSMGGLEAGDQSRYFDWNKTPSMAVAICYEISDGIGLRNAVKKGSQLILTVANLDPYPRVLHNQFLSLARFRSIENGRETILVANTGPSGLISSGGRIIKLFESDNEQVGLLYPSLHSEQTFYNKFGNKPLLIAFNISLILVIVFRDKLSN